MTKETKDYAKYFDFANTKVIKENENGKTIRVKGRDIHLISEPDLRRGKQRSKKEVQVLYDQTLPKHLKYFGMGRKYWIMTYGCQMNEHDTEVMRGILEEMGYAPAGDKLDADVILLNTCAIRENAEDKVFGELGHLKALKLERPELLLGLCGCMSQERAVVNRIMQKHPHVDMVFGTHNIHRLPYILKEAHFAKEMVIDVWSKEGDIIENLPKKRGEHLRAWVNIMYGCDKFCTYCIVPYTRGKERSRMPEDVLQEVRELAHQGYKEITLLGQNVNAYGKDFTDRNYRFADLMDDIRLIAIPRVRFMTSHPRDFDDQLIDVLAKGGNLVEHIHLPMQSGNTEVLKRMGRKYTRERFLELAAKIQQTVPNAQLTTDIIVGFPKETEEQFSDTLSLLKEAGISSAYTYIYSPREGTPAFSMPDDIPYKVKQNRLARLNTLVAELSLAHHQRFVGEQLEVLIEGQSKNNAKILSGRTRGNKLVHLEGPMEWIGSLVAVEITSAKTWYLTGKSLTYVPEKEVTIQ